MKLREEFEKETGLSAEIALEIDSYTASEYVKWLEKRVSVDSIVSDFFSFAKYLNENFHYFDNTSVGDVYKDNDGQGLYSENDIYDEWLNNR